jgi:hypothetical protein
MLLQVTAPPTLALLSPPHCFFSARARQLYSHLSSPTPSVRSLCQNSPLPFLSQSTQQPHSRSIQCTPQSTRSGTLRGALSTHPPSPNTPCVTLPQPQPRACAVPGAQFQGIGATGTPITRPWVKQRHHPISGIAARRDDSTVPQVCIWGRIAICRPIHDRKGRMAWLQSAVCAARCAVLECRHKRQPQPIHCGHGVSWQWPQDVGFYTSRRDP